MDANSSMIAVGAFSGFFRFIKWYIFPCHSFFYNALFFKKRVNAIKINFFSKRGKIIFGKSVGCFFFTKRSHQPLGDNNINRGGNKKRFYMHINKAWQSARGGIGVQG